VGLYIHIPFCKKKCPYCDFYSIVAPSKDLEKAYSKSLIKEFELLLNFLKSLGIQQLKIVTVYVGGGTPSIFSGAFYEKVFNFVKDRTLWEPEEISIEVNPESLSKEKLKSFEEAGFNRLSLGIQSLSEKGLKELGRIHSLEESLKALTLVKGSKIKNISADLIFAWKGQKLEDLKKELELLLSYPVDHISAYELTIAPETEFFKRYGCKYWISHEEVENFYKFLGDFLSKKGLIRYEISNYAKASMECKHNLRYWKVEPYLGLGAGAVSRVKNLRWKNPGLFDYLQSLENDRLPLEIVEHMSNLDFFKEHLFMGLRLTKGVNLKKLKTNYGYEIAPEVLRILKSQDFIEVNQNQIKLTLKGILLHNQVVRALWDGIVKGK